MRFSGERHVTAPVTHVWEALHDVDVLRSIIPGCADMAPRAGSTYGATLQARVGPITDTYRGAFTITDHRPGTDLQVRVRAGGRFGRLHVDLSVRLDEGNRPETTTLAYDARAAVGGVVSRLGRPTLTVAGGHFTGCFFRDLERALQAGRPNRLLAPTG